MTNICLRIWNWCFRFRYRRGYGVHSPSDFFLITFVIYEKLPYYAYASLHQLRNQVASLPHYREKVDKLLLRLANYLHPSVLFEVGTGGGLSTLYLTAGNAKMKVFTSDHHCNNQVMELLSGSSLISYEQDDINQIQRIWKEMHTSSVMVHIAHTSRYKEVLEQLLPLVGDQTCFLIGSPYADKEKERWWKEIIEDERTGVTFDLYDLGIVFFDKKRIKEHRIVNFF